MQTVHTVIIHFHGLFLKKDPFHFFNIEDTYQVSKITQLLTSSQHLKEGFYLVSKSHIILLGKNLKIWVLLDQNVNYILYLEKQQQGPTVFKTL